jgi:hypothetical protein
VNDQLSEIVQNSLNKNRTIEEDGLIKQNYDQIYLSDHLISGRLFDSNPMFVPVKKLGGQVIDTYLYNLIFLWLMIAAGYLILYFDIIGKLLNR